MINLFEKLTDYNDYLMKHPFHTDIGLEININNYQEIPLQYLASNKQTKLLTGMYTHQPTPKNKQQSIQQSMNFTIIVCF